MTVAALYVEREGVYAGLPDVEVWDEARDARTYAGPWPVVAHPPCARWCVLAPLVESLLADRLGDRYRVGEDGGCFAAALEAVERWGGILEHPAYSIAWERFGLPRPGRHGWTSNFDRPGMSAEVSQSAYGHPARKRTWLYFVGGDPPDLLWDEPATSMQVSEFGQASIQRRGIAPLTNGRSNPTPVGFRDVLVAAARSSARIAA